MSKYDDTNVTHINELTGAKHIDSRDCGYCERGWSKGFHTCPSCGTSKPSDWDGEGYFDRKAKAQQ